MSSASSEDKTLIPPNLFGIVCSNVYRANEPVQANMGFLKTLNLKSIVFLSAETLSKHFKQFIDANNIKLSHLGMRAWHPEGNWRPVNDDLVKQALEQVLDARNHPVLIACASGIHETGTVVACIRRLQHWCMTAIIDEYRRFGGNKARLSNEQFFELFDIDLVSLPPAAHLPAWLLDQMKMEREEQVEFVQLLSKYAQRRYLASNAAVLPSTECESPIPPDSASAASESASSPSSTASSVQPRAPSDASTLFTAVRGPFRLPPPLKGGPDAIRKLFGAEARRPLEAPSDGSFDEKDYMAMLAKEEKEKKEKKEKKKKEEQQLTNNASSSASDSSQSVDASTSAAIEDDEKRRKAEKKRLKEEQARQEAEALAQAIASSSTANQAAYQQYLYLLNHAPLVTNRVLYSRKQSLIDDDDD